MTSETEATIALVRIVVLILALSVAVTAAPRRAYIPESVALVVAGLVVAALLPDLRLGITPGLVAAVLIPGLVFEAAYRLHWPTCAGASASSACWRFREWSSPRRSLSRPSGGSRRPAIGDPRRG